MTLKESLIELEIEDYGQKIFESNSRGELFHVLQYFNLAEWYIQNKNDFEKLTGFKTFRDLFIDIVEEANKTWSRPQSVYQHIQKITEERMIIYQNNLNTCIL